jgi:vacuolar-type H+-ATPase subunit F/Vma7
VREASSWDDIKNILTGVLPQESGISVVFIAAHLIPEEKRGEFRDIAGQSPFTVVSLPTKWAPPKPVDMKKLLLEALGFG